MKTTLKSKKNVVVLIFIHHKTQKINQACWMRNKIKNDFS